MKLIKNKPDHFFNNIFRQNSFSISLAQVFSYNFYYVELPNNKYYFCKNDFNKYINCFGIFSTLDEMLSQSFSYNINYKLPEKITEYIDVIYNNDDEYPADILKQNREYIYKHALNYTDDKNKKYFSKNMPLDDKEFSLRPTVRRLLFFNGANVATAIDVDILNEEIKIKNFTDNFACRAFGIDETPTWGKYQAFLEERCVPRTRYGIKKYLRDINIDSYDPEEIIKVTHAKTTDDPDWILNEREIEL